MAEPKSFKVGQAPWEVSQEKQPSTFKVGEAPWEKPQQPEEPALTKFTRTAVDTIVPVAGAIGGGLMATPETLGLGTIPGAALGYAGGKQAARIINHHLLGDPYEETSMSGLAGQTAKDVLEGAAMETGGALLGKAVEAAPKLVGNAGKYLKKSAEQLAENATGATRVQSEKFAEGAGRELLDRGIVSFGDDAEKIAAKSAQEIKKAESGIDSSLKALDEKGASVDVNNVVSNLESKISELKKDPSQADTVKKLEQIVLNITETGDSNISLSAAEKIKRGFNKMAKNWMNPEQGEAGKTAYLAYRDAVEEAAKAADPSIAKIFTESKKTFGLMAPIEEAATKRAAQLNQHPYGGFLDMASAAGGAAAGGLPGAVVTSVGRRVLAPRVASSLAVASDVLSKPRQC
jgi:hypothetical protein